MIVEDGKDGKDFQFDFYHPALRAKEMQHHADVCNVRAEIATIIIGLEHFSEELDSDFELDKESEWYSLLH